MLSLNKLALLHFYKSEFLMHGYRLEQILSTPCLQKRQLNLYRPQHETKTKQGLDKDTPPFSKAVGAKHRAKFV